MCMLIYLQLRHWLTRGMQQHTARLQAQHLIFSTAAMAQVKVGTLPGEQARPRSRAVASSLVTHSPALSPCSQGPHAWHMVAMQLEGQRPARSPGVQPAATLAQVKIWPWLTPASALKLCTRSLWLIKQDLVGSFLYTLGLHAACRWYSDQHGRITLQQACRQLSMLPQVQACSARAGSRDLPLSPSPSTPVSGRTE